MLTDIARMLLTAPGPRTFTFSVCARFLQQHVSPSCLDSLLGCGSPEVRGRAKTRSTAVSEVYGGHLLVGGSTPRPIPATDPAITSYITAKRGRNIRVDTRVAIELAVSCSNC